MSDSIKQRIRHLLAVAGNDASTEGEIDNALRFAKNLMDKHHLSEDDLHEEQADLEQIARDAKKGRVFASVTTRQYYWEGRLASFCCEFVGGVKFYNDPCRMISRTPRGIAILNGEKPQFGKRVCFYGCAEDAMIAAELFHELRLTIISMARLKFGGWCKGDGGMYSEGFVIGLRDQLAKQEQAKLTDSRERGLVVVDRRNALVNLKQEIASEWLRVACGIKLRSDSSRTGANGSQGAHREGRADGRRSNVSAARRPKLGA